MHKTPHIGKFYLCFAFIASILGCGETKNKEQVKNREIVLPNNLEIIEVDKSVSFDTGWYDYKFKVVVFFRKAGPHPAFDLDWQSAISEFRDIAFLFYVSEKDSTKLAAYLREAGFTHPVIHDPNEEFRKLNIKEKEWTFISFLVKDNEIVGLGNPSLTDFNKRLNELVKESK